jgi:hypothetical protein
MASAKQNVLIRDMIEVLFTEFNFCKLRGIELRTEDSEDKTLELIKDRNFDVSEASKLIKENSYEYYTLLNAGQCTVKQYAILAKIKGRTPKFKRHYISYTQACDWISTYSKKFKKAS